MIIIIIIDMYTYIYIYIHTYIYAYIYIYIVCQQVPPRKTYGASRAELAVHLATCSNRTLIIKLRLRNQYLIKKGYT